LSSLDENGLIGYSKILAIEIISLNKLIMPSPV